MKVRGVNHSFFFLKLSVPRDKLSPLGIVGKKKSVLLIFVFFSLSLALIESCRHYSMKVWDQRENNVGNYMSPDKQRREAQFEKMRERK